MNAFREYTDSSLLRELRQIVGDYAFFRGVVLHELHQSSPVLNLSVSMTPLLVAFEKDDTVRTISPESGDTISLVKMANAFTVHVIREFLIVGLLGMIRVKRGNDVFTLRSKSPSPPVNYALTPDNLLVVLWDRGDIELWDLERRTIVTRGRFDSPNHPLKVAVVNNRVVLALANNSLVLWDWHNPIAPTGGDVIPLITFDTVIRCLHSDGDNVLMGMWNGLIHRVDLSGNIITTFIGHTSAVINIAILEDGLIASGSSDQTIRIWEPDGTLYLVLDQCARVSSLVALPLNQIGSSSVDGTIKIWV